MRGATVIDVTHLQSEAFQSTRPCGARRGAGRSFKNVSGCFNPRAHAGRDIPEGGNLRARGEFQSTRPCGARRPSDVPNRFLWIVSIHAPMRGATLDADADADQSAGFNPRAHAGRDALWTKTE